MIKIIKMILGESYAEQLPAEIDYEGETLYLRIKKVDGHPKRIWRIRYISVNDTYIEHKPEEMQYFDWKKKHHQYRTRLRSQSMTLEDAAKNMLSNIEQLQAGKRKLSDY